MNTSRPSRTIASPPPPLPAWPERVQDFLGRVSVQLALMGWALVFLVLFVARLIAPLSVPEPVRDIAETLRSLPGALLSVAMLLGSLGVLSAGLSILLALGRQQPDWGRRMILPAFGLLLGGAVAVLLLVGIRNPMG